MSNRLLEVIDLQTFFFTSRGVLKAVNGVSFGLDEGETLGLVGESGCGKTITGLSIMRLEPKPGARISGGQIIFKGRDLVQEKESELRKVRGGQIAMIMQDPNTSLNPVFTVGNQIGEAVRLHQGLTGDAARNRIVDSLRLVQIADPERRLGSYPHQFSGGMRQRVVGAMALSCVPSLIIADEPTTALDVTTQAQYLDVLAQVQDETKVGLIFITHDLGIVATMCHRVCVMYLGRIVESGTVEDVWNNPRHPYTAALINSIPQLDRRLDKLASIPGRVPSLLELPDGCTFHPRCEFVDERCRKEYPPRADVGGDHCVSCWRVWD